MRRPLVFLLAVLLLAAGAAAGAQTPCAYGSSGTLKVLGPEAHNVLWHQAGYTGFWKSLDSTVTFQARLGALEYSDGYFYSLFSGLTSAWWGGACPVNGAEIIAAVSYWEAENTLDQKAWYAVGTLIASNGTPLTTCTMHEIPHLAAAVDTGTVTLTWTACTETEITGYQVVRSADGLGNWSDVGGIVTEPTQSDTPGQGTWYYALKVRFEGAPTDRLSPKHGLSLQVVVP